MASHKKEGKGKEKYLGHHFRACPAESVLLCSDCRIWFGVAGKRIDCKLELLPHLCCYWGLVMRMGEINFDSWDFEITLSNSCDETVSLCLDKCWNDSCDVPYIFVDCKFAPSPSELTYGNHACYHLILKTVNWQYVLFGLEHDRQILLKIDNRMGINR